MEKSAGRIGNVFLFVENRDYLKIPAKSSYKGGSLSTAISKLVTKLVRHHEQEERQSDAAVHWDTIRPKLLRAFADRGAQDFSEKDTSMKEVTRRGSSIARIRKIPGLIC